MESYSSKHYQLVETAIRWISETRRQQPNLDTLSEQLGVSAFHLQRTFSKWAGISPKKFLQYATKESILQRLATSKSLLDLTYESGLSSPGRLHDLIVHSIAMTPHEAKNKGRGVIIDYAFSDTPFGLALLAWTEKGLCHLAFMDDQATEFARLQRTWSKAQFRQAGLEGKRLVDRIFRGNSGSISVVLQGSPFQTKVWEALIRIPPATLVTYSDVGKAIGKPKAQRPIGNAVGENPVAFLIPCHRVIRESGALGGYRWGSTRKLTIQAWECALEEGGA